jgi:hypothetical protein
MRMFLLDCTGSVSERQGAHFWVGNCLIRDTIFGNELRTLHAAEGMLK